MWKEDMKLHSQGPNHNTSRTVWGFFNVPRISEAIMNKGCETDLWFIGSCVFCAPLDRHVDRHIDRHSTDASVDISTETRPMYRPTLDRHSTGIWRSTYRPIHRSRGAQNTHDPVFQALSILWEQKKNNLMVLKSYWKIHKKFIQRAASLLSFLFWTRLWYCPPLLESILSRQDCSFCPPPDRIIRVSDDEDFLTLQGSSCPVTDLRKCKVKGWLLEMPDKKKIQWRTEIRSIRESVAFWAIWLPLHLGIFNIIISTNSGYEQTRALIGSLLTGYQQIPISMENGRYGGKNLVN